MSYFLWVIWIYSCGRKIPIMHRQIWNLVKTNWQLVQHLTKFLSGWAHKAWSFSMAVFGDVCGVECCNWYRQFALGSGWKSGDWQEFLWASLIPCYCAVYSTDIRWGKREEGEGGDVDVVGLFGTFLISLTVCCLFAFFFFQWIACLGNLLKNVPPGRMHVGRLMLCVGYIAMGDSTQGITGVVVLRMWWYLESPDRQLALSSYVCDFWAVVFVNLQTGNFFLSLICCEGHTKNYFQRLIVLNKQLTWGGVNQHI